MPITAPPTFRPARYGITIGATGTVLTVTAPGVLGFAASGGGVPGGTTGQVQYNNAGAFGGIAEGLLGQVLVSGGVGVPPAFAAVSSIIAGANPSASLGLAAVNGVATTYLRSDGAPALDQAIAPTWSGAHVFTNARPITVSNSDPNLYFNATGAAADEKLWRENLSAKVWTLATRTDADGAGRNAIAITRGTGVALTNISLGDATGNPTFSFLGTGLVSIGGGLNVNGGNIAAGANSITGGVITGTRVVVTGSTVATNGIYLPAANTVGISTSSTLRFSVSTTIVTSTLPITITSTNPRYLWNESDQGADGKIYDVNVENGVFQIRTRTDADGAGVTFFEVTRSGTGVIDIALGETTNNPSVRTVGSGAFSTGGIIATGSAGSAASASYQAPSDANTGIYFPGADQFGITAGGAVIQVAQNLLQIDGTLPAFNIFENDQAANAGMWRVNVNAGSFQIATRTDANGAGVNAFNATRGAGTAIGEVQLGNATSNNTFRFLGTGSIRLDNTATGAQTATFVATNKPGAGTAGPIAWVSVLTAAGTQGYIPIFGA